MNNAHSFNNPQTRPKRSTVLNKKHRIGNKAILSAEKSSIPKDNSSIKDYSSDDNSSGQKKTRQSRSRQENSLGELTKNFIKFVKESGTATININDIVKKLKVKKRRIYDITNVLEGIGYIRKHAKNEISWINEDALYNSSLSNDSNDSFDRGEPTTKQIQEYQSIEKENAKIDNRLNQIKNEFNLISNKQDFSDYGYVSFEDLKDLSTSEKIDLLAIKAPKGTFVDIISPKESKQAYLKVLREMEQGKVERDEKLLDTLKKEHHLFLDSQNGEISVYRITNEDYSLNPLSMNINEEDNNKLNTPLIAPYKSSFSFFPGNNQIFKRNEEK